MHAVASENRNRIGHATPRLSKEERSVRTAVATHKLLPEGVCTLRV